jgi:23S rRNA (uracil1939-C5)-methyltransferase
VLELFAGSGNFTDVLAGAGFASIVAVEAVTEAAASLRQRQLPGVTVTEADLFNAAAVVALGRGCADARLLVLDPPRDGCSQLGTLLDACRVLEKVAYISCSLATFARDAGLLLARGFRVGEVQPLDQFPHTPHVELLATFSRGL